MMQILENLTQNLDSAVPRALIGAPPASVFVSLDWQVLTSSEPQILFQKVQHSESVFPEYLKRLEMVVMRLQACKRSYRDLDGHKS